MSVAYLLLGSNQGERAAILQKARERLQQLSVAPIGVSSLYESEPWGFEAETWFINQAVKIDTDLKPHDLLMKILEIEKSLGRVRENGGERIAGYSSRTIDIDILFYEDIVNDTVDLQLPHPRMHLRRFVLLPLSEIAPGLIHPVLNVSIKKLLEECKDKSKIKKSRNN